MPLNLASLFKNDRQSQDIQLPQQLCYSGLSGGIEQGYNYQWKQYFIQQHLSRTSTETVFMLFTRQHDLADTAAALKPENSSDVSSDKEIVENDFSDVKLQRDPDSGPKLHVALKTENSADINSDIQTAFNAILCVLDHHKIESFKVVLQDKLDVFIASGQYGKIFTVYLDDRTKAQVNQIASDIEHAIDNARCYPHLQPPEKRATDCVKRVDQAISGCQFVTFADARVDNGGIAVAKSNAYRNRFLSDASSIGSAGDAVVCRTVSDVEFVL